MVFSGLGDSAPSSVGQFNHDLFLVAFLPYTFVADLHGPSDPQDDPEAFVYKHYQFVGNFLGDFPAF